VSKPVRLHSGEEGAIFGQSGKKWFAGSAVVPSDGSAGYEPGCVYVHTDGVAGTALYINDGTGTSCDFNAMSAAGGIDLNGLTATAAELNAHADASGRIVNVAAAATALALTNTLHANRLVVVPIITGAGLTITLPAATGSGDIYRVLNNGVQTVSLTITGLAGDLFHGRADVFTATITEGPDSFLADGTDDIKYTFNITTMGGIGKDEAELIDIATDAWLVHIRAYGSGTLATGFA